MPFDEIQHFLFPIFFSIIFEPDNDFEIWGRNSKQDWHFLHCEKQIKKPEKIEILNNWYLGQVKNEWHHGTGNAIPLQQEIIYCWLQVGYFIVFYEDLRPITMINWSRFVATWSQYHIKRILSLTLTPTYTLMFAWLYCEMVIGANLCSMIIMILFMFNYGTIMPGP